MDGLTFCPRQSKLMGMNTEIAVSLRKTSEISNPYFNIHLLSEELCVAVSDVRPLRYRELLYSVSTYFCTQGRGAIRAKLHMPFITYASL